MRKRTLKKLLPLLRVIAKLSEDEKRIVFQFLTHEGCEGIYECVDNILHNPNIPTDDRKQMHFSLSAYKDQLRFLTNREKKAEEKKKVLQQAYKPMGTIFSYVLPMLERDFK